MHAYVLAKTCFFLSENAFERKRFESVVGIFSLLPETAHNAQSSNLQTLCCLVQYKFRVSPRLGSRSWWVRFPLSGTIITFIQTLAYLILIFKSEKHGFSKKREFFDDSLFFSKIFRFQA